MLEAQSPSPGGSRANNLKCQRAICCATASGGGGLGFPQPRPTELPPRLIEIHPVDRDTARKNMAAGLWAGAFATAIFALSFVAAFLYIAQG